MGNACRLLNGMDIAARMIERGDIEYALVVDGETNVITENTIERLLQPDAGGPVLQRVSLRSRLGPGAAAMVLGRAEECPTATASSAR